LNEKLPLADTEKQWIFRATVAFTEPGVQHLCRFWTEKCAPMFSALSLTVDVGACSQDDVLAAQANQFGNPERRLEEEQNHSPIAAPNPTGAIGDRQQSIHLLRLRNSMGRRWWRLVGIASIRWQRSACAGSCKTMYRKKE
jgi:hypothetical protein